MSITDDSFTCPINESFSGVYGDISDSTLLAETCHSTPLQDVLGTFAAMPGPSGPNAGNFML